MTEKFLLEKNASNQIKSRQIINMMNLGRKRMHSLKGPNMKAKKEKGPTAGYLPKS